MCPSGKGRPPNVWKNDQFLALVFALTSVVNGGTAAPLNREHDQRIFTQNWTRDYGRREMPNSGHIPKVYIFIVLSS
jgi:hypothetical protein